MSCEKIMDKVYEYSGGMLHDPASQNAMPLFTRVSIGLHLLVCPDCAQEVERFEVCRDILHSDFMPFTPGMEDTVMTMIAVTEGEDAQTADSVGDIPGGFSTRGWVIAGLVMLVSLATAFFGLDFNKVAVAAGISFMLPVGITIGIVLTVYGALFIGSHLKELKELSERFGLDKRV